TWHEFETAFGNGVGRGINVVGADCDVLDTFALVLLKVFLDLALVVRAFVDRDPDFTARRGERAAGQSGELAGNVEIADFAAIERLQIDSVPSINVAAHDVVRQRVEVIKAAPAGFGVTRPKPIEFGGVGRPFAPVGSHKIEQRPAYADDGGH